MTQREEDWFGLPQVLNRRSTLRLSCLIRSSLFIALTACSDACSTTSFDDYDHLSPPTPELRAISVDSGGVLKITVVVSNRWGVHLQMANSPQCPFAFRIFPDSTGEYLVQTGPGCPASGAATDLAPGDSVRLSRMLSATDLTQYTAGTYGINVSVATNTGTTTAWAGAVKLPLSSKP